MYYLDTGTLTQVRHERGNIICVIRLREHAVPALGLERQAVQFKKSYRVLRGKAAQRAVKEAPVPGDIGHKGFDVTVIRDVAAPLAGDPELAPKLPVRVKKRDRKAALRRGIRAHHSGRAAADDDKFSFVYHISCSNV